MQLTDVVTASASASASSSRREKTAALAEALQRAARGTDRDIVAVASYLAGVLPQRRIGVGWRGLAALPAPAGRATLTVAEVDAALAAIARPIGAGSASARSAAVAELFGRATGPEQEFLRNLLTGQLRQGALDGIMLQAVAKASGVPEALVRRGVMLAGYAAPVAVAALRGGAQEVAALRLEVGRPLRPMLAAPAPDAAAAFAAASPGGAPVAVETKLDGIRMQVHVDEGRVRVFTRSLEEVTDRLPEVVELGRSLPVRRAVLDGEAIAMRPDGRPEPFQVTGSRTASTADPRSLAARTPITGYLFDVLHLDGEDLLDTPAEARHDLLVAVAPPEALVPRQLASGPAQVDQVAQQAVAAGHEGVVVKSLTVSYAAGRRGAGWVKVKPRHTLDLVVLGVEWGSGRRRGLLSNIHLGARDPATGGFVMLGKTFKGMTDEMLAWQTERFLDLEVARSGHVVQVRPEQVVEIAYAGLQRSRRYPGGLALRFARVVRYRDDKSAAEADTIDRVREVACVGEVAGVGEAPAADRD